MNPSRPSPHIVHMPLHCVKRPKSAPPQRIRLHLPKHRIWTQWRFSRARSSACHAAYHNPADFLPPPVPAYHDWAGVRAGVQEGMPLDLYVHTYSVPCLSKTLPCNVVPWERFLLVGGGGRRANPLPPSLPPSPSARSAGGGEADAGCGCGCGGCHPASVRRAARARV